MCRKEELHKVRPSPKGNAICFCPEPSDAKWIAKRLNLASVLEQKINYNSVINKLDLTIKSIRNKNTGWYYTTT